MDGTSTAQTARTPGSAKNETHTSTCKSRDFYTKDGVFFKIKFLPENPPQCSACNLARRTTSHVRPGRLFMKEPGLHGQQTVLAPVPGNYWYQ